MIRFLVQRPVANLAVLLVLNLLMLSVQLRTPGGDRLLKIWAWDAAAPLASTSSRLTGSAGTLWQDYGNLLGVRQQNRRLQQENYDLRMELQRLRELDRLNLRLEDYRRFQSEFLYSTVVARIIGKSPPFWKTTILLNAGSKDGVKPDSAILTPLGVVGRVLVAAHSTSEAELITNPGAATGVLVGDNRIQGIAQGTAEENVRVQYIASQERIQVGDAAVTSGTDRIYPPGLPVGRIVREQNSGEIYKEVYLGPAVNLANLQEVLIITGYQYHP